MRIADRLPVHSRYKAAVWDDDDVAEDLAQLKARKTFGFAEWTPERAELAKVVERLDLIHSRLIAQSSKTGKGPKVKPQPRPTTAVDRLEHVRLKRQHADLTAQLLPNQLPPP